MANQPYAAYEAAAPYFDLVRGLLMASISSISSLRTSSMKCSTTSLVGLALSKRVQI